MALSFRIVSPAFAAVPVVLLLTLLSAQSHGAEKKASPAPATATAPAPPRTPLLSPEQLRACVAQKDKLGTDTEAVLKTKSDLAAAKAEIDSTGAALTQEGATLDRTSAEAVAAYNAKVLERNGRIDAYQAKAAAYNADAENVLSAKEAYEKACANRRYDERDLNDIQRKK